MPSTDTSSSTSALASGKLESGASINRMESCLPSPGGPTIRTSAALCTALCHTLHYPNLPSIDRHGKWNLLKSVSSTLSAPSPAFCLRLSSLRFRSTARSIGLPSLYTNLSSVSSHFCLADFNSFQLKMGTGSNRKQMETVLL